MYIKTHSQCGGFIDSKPCPYNANISVSNGLKTCGIHVNELHVQNQKKRKRMFSWIEPGKALNSACCLCSQKMFYIPKTFGKCKEHTYCSSCSEYCDNSCPMCLSIESDMEMID